jgi:CBS domain-containing protein
MKSIKQLLDSKGHYIWFIGPEAPVFEAIKLMAEKEVGALLVMESGRLIGIITERDYARNVILRGRSSKDTLVKDIMTRSVLCAQLEQSIEEGMALMTERRVRYLPVITGERVEGLVSLGDMVKAIIAEQKFVIEQLEHYITS